jgi:hypothetical protein
MLRLEDLQPNAAVRGVIPDSLVTVVNVQWFGSEALELTYKTPAGKVANELLYRHDEPRLEVVEQGRPWSFDGDGGLFRLVSEAQRIGLAHLFDPVLAVHTSVVEPLPHQITAVYESMLPRQPLHRQILRKFERTAGALPLLNRQEPIQWVVDEAVNESSREEEDEILSEWGDQEIQNAIDEAVAENEAIAWESYAEYLREEPLEDEPPFGHERDEEEDEQDV